MDFGSFLIGYVRRFYDEEDANPDSRDCAGCFCDNAFLAMGTVFADVAPVEYRLWVGDKQVSRIKTPRHFLYNEHGIIKETQESDKEGFAEVIKK